MPRLTGKRLKFVEAYTGGAMGRASEAARLAGYSDACVEAHRLLREPHIRDAIRARLDVASLGHAELLLRLSDHARGVPPDCYFEDSDGKPALSYQRLKDAGLLHLIVGFDREGRPKLADPLRALELIARVIGAIGPDTTVNNQVRIDVANLTIQQLERIRDTGRIVDVG